MVKTFSEACKKLKLDPRKALPEVTGMPVRFRRAQIAYAKLLIIAEALNEGWMPDWDNSGEWKYWPWFWMNNPGFRFCGSDFTVSLSNASSGSRLCFRTRELSDYAGKTFLPLWRDLMIISKPVKTRKK